MKELAKYIVRSRLPAKTRRTARPPEEKQNPEPQINIPDPESLPDHSVYKPLDSWETRHRPEKDRPKVPETEDAQEKPKRLTRARKTFETVEEPETPPPSKKRMALRKKRKASLSISVSEEEAELLRQFAAAKGYYFSEWARDTLFRAMKRKPPARPKPS